MGFQPQNKIKPFASVDFGSRWLPQKRRSAFPGDAIVRAKERTT
jgi:hypothetical protein